VAVAAGATLLTGSLWSQEQGATPTFRSESHVVSVEFSISRGFFGVRRPFTGLKATDVNVALDDDTYAVSELKEYKPGHYVAGFIPPERYHDGRTHDIRLRIKNLTGNGGIKLTFSVPAPASAGDKGATGPVQVP